MNIAVIGAGNIGGTLAIAWARAGHTVAVAGRHASTERADCFEEAGVTVGSREGIIAGADVVVVSIPFAAVADLRGALSDLAESATVLDTTNYVPGMRDTSIAAVDDGQAESSWVAGVLGRPVVKAFNTVGAATLRDRTTYPRPDNRIAVPISADRPDDRRRAAQLVTDAGFEAVHDGIIEDSWRQQPGTPVYTADLPAAAAFEALSHAARADTDAWRTRVRASRA